jgi:two-component system sensor histidine kinase AgrC
LTLISLTPLACSQSVKDISTFLLFFGKYHSELCPPGLVATHQGFSSIRFDHRFNGTKADTPFLRFSRKTGFEYLDPKFFLYKTWVDGLKDKMSAGLEYSQSDGSFICWKNFYGLKGVIHQVSDYLRSSCFLGNITVTRTQRHDFINHLQAVYALLKTDRNDEAQSYIENLYHDIRISGEIIHLSIPEVAALLLVKMGTASLKNISFAVEVESNLKGLRVKAIELNSIIGNLVDNAFEAVEVFPADKRTVRLRIFETGRHFVFQTINPGFIEKELRIKIFEPGFSTKSEKRGIGLSSVKSMVEANGGKTLVSSDKARGTKFTVIFPKKQEERRYIFHRLAASQRG